MLYSLLHPYIVHIYIYTPSEVNQHNHGKSAFLICQSTIFNYKCPSSIANCYLTRGYAHTYILYIIIYLSGRHHGLMDFAPATQWPWHFWKNAIATLATQMHHAQRRFKDTDSNFEILWEVLSQLWGHEGHVWWLAYACCTRSSLVCRAYASASWWVQLSSAQSSFALRKMYSLRLFPTVYNNV